MEESEAAAAAHEVAEADAAASTFDVAIAGLGAMGAAAAFELARRGLTVIGFDRFVPPHPFGSTHSESRIIREAYFEHPVYVPMVQRAFDAWRTLEELAATALLQTTGGVMIGRPDSELVEGARHSAQLHRLQHAVLTADEVRARFAALNPEADMVGVWEPRAGVLDAEACLKAFLAQARLRGAELHYEEPVVAWTHGAGHLEVATPVARYRARQLVVCVGAWLGALVPALQPVVAVERQVLHWFAPLAEDAPAFAPGRCPIHLWQFDGGRFFYGFPELGVGVKMGFHHGGEATAADRVRRQVAATEQDEVRAAVRRFVPTAGSRIRASAVCLYTNTPDGHFRIGRLPGQSNVVIASPCSGHGFKFAPVIGEIVADLVEERRPMFDVALFGLG